MNGTCICGGVSVTAKHLSDIHVCHCSTCRCWGGGPFLAMHAGPDVEFSGELKPVSYRSSDWAERGFCPRCGSNLFYRLVASNEYILSAGLFAQHADFHVGSQIFIDEKPDYYSLANDTPKLTGAQVFAQFGKADS